MDGSTRSGWQATRPAKALPQGRESVQGSCTVQARSPDETVAGGLGPYMQAARKGFTARSGVAGIHITWCKDGKDNEMERLNGTIRDRQKSFRGCGTRHTAN